MINGTEATTSNPDSEILDYFSNDKKNGYIFDVYLAARCHEINGTNEHEKHFVHSFFHLLGTNKADFFGDKNINVSVVSKVVENAIIGVRDRNSDPDIIQNRCSNDERVVENNRVIYNQLKKQYNSYIDISNDLEEMYKVLGQEHARFYTDDAVDDLRATNRANLINTIYCSMRQEPIPQDFLKTMAERIFEKTNSKNDASGQLSAARRNTEPAQASTGALIGVYNFFRGVVDSYIYRETLYIDEIATKYAALAQNRYKIASSNFIQSNAVINYNDNSSTTFAAAYKQLSKDFVDNEGSNPQQNKFAQIKAHSDVGAFKKAKGSTLSILENQTKTKTNRDAHHQSLVYNVFPQKIIDIIQSYDHATKVVIDENDSLLTKSNFIEFPVSYKKTLFKNMFHMALVYKNDTTGEFSSAAKDIPIQLANLEKNIISLLECSIAVILCAHGYTSYDDVTTANSTKCKSYIDRIMDIAEDQHGIHLFIEAFCDSLNNPFSVSGIMINTKISEIMEVLHKSLIISAIGNPKNYRGVSELVEAADEITKDINDIISILKIHSTKIHYHMENQINLVHKGLRVEKEKAFDQIDEESDEEIEEEDYTSTEESSENLGKKVDDATKASRP